MRKVIDMIINFDFNSSNAYSREKLIANIYALSSEYILSKNPSWHNYNEVQNIEQENLYGDEGITDVDSLTITLDENHFKDKTKYVSDIITIVHETCHVLQSKNKEKDSNFIFDPWSFDFTFFINYFNLNFGSRTTDSIIENCKQLNTQTYLMNPCEMRARKIQYEFLDFVMSQINPSSLNAKQKTLYGMMITQLNEQKKRKDIDDAMVGMPITNYQVSEYYHVVDILQELIINKDYLYVAAKKGSLHSVFGNSIDNFIDGSVPGKVSFQKAKNLLLLNQKPKKIKEFYNICTHLLQDKKLNLGSFFKGEMLTTMVELYMDLDAKPDKKELKGFEKVLRDQKILIPGYGYRAYTIECLDVIKSKTKANIFTVDKCVNYYRQREQWS